MKEYIIVYFTEGKLKAKTVKISTANIISFHKNAKISTCENFYIYSITNMLFIVVKFTYNTNTNKWPTISNWPILSTYDNHVTWIIQFTIKSTYHLLKVLNDKMSSWSTAFSCVPWLASVRVLPCVLHCGWQPNTSRDHPVASLRCSSHVVMLKINAPKIWDNWHYLTRATIMVVTF